MDKRKATGKEIGGMVEHKKEALESEILNSVKKFESETGLFLKDIEFIILRSMAGESFRIITKVTI